MSVEDSSFALLRRYQEGEGGIAEALGLCEAAWRKAKAYAAERPSMGKTIDKHEMIADYLDQMKNEIQETILALKKDLEETTHELNRYKGETECLEALKENLVTAHQKPQQIGKEIDKILQTKDVVIVIGIVGWNRHQYKTGIPSCLDDRLRYHLNKLNKIRFCFCIDPIEIDLNPVGIHRI